MSGDNNGLSKNGTYLKLIFSFKIPSNEKLFDNHLRLI
jgi:hypothetical protein